MLGASAVLMATVHCGIAQAAWPNNPTTNLPLCIASGDQQVPATVPDGVGGAIITWQDSRTGGNNIFAQRVNAAGVPQWALNGVALCTAADDQYSPVIVSDGAGGAIVAWYDHRTGTNLDIYAQRVSAAGTPQWTANGVALCTAVDDQLSPAITSDLAGGAIVSWYDYRTGNADIYAQRVNAAGVPQWTTDGVALCAATDDQSNPSIASDGAGGAIVTWMDNRSGANYHIYAQRVNAAGVPQWTVDGVALCVAASDQTNPTIVSGKAGAAIVTWMDYRSGASDIYAQGVSAAGVPQWTLNGNVLSAAANNQSNPTIVIDGAGGAFVAWEDDRSGTNYDIYAQHVNAAGVPKWTADGVALCTAANQQFAPTIAADQAGGAIVTWYDYRTASTYDIYAQHVNAAGATQWTSGGVALGTAKNNQINPAIAPDGAGGAIVSWEDYRSGTADIYAQNIRADGTLGGSLLAAPPLPIAANFSLLSVQPNPSLGDFHVSFSLVDGTEAVLELFDLTGRRIESHSLGALGAGTHVALLSAPVSALPPGIYCVILTQGSHRAFSKVAIVR